MFNINPVYSVNNKNNNKLAWLFLWTWHYPLRCGCQLEAELKKTVRRCIDEARDQLVKLWDACYVGVDDRNALRTSRPVSCRYDCRSCV